MLSTLATRSLGEIDALVIAFREEYELQLVTVPFIEGKFSALAVPSGGIFPVVYGDKGCLSGHAIGMGLPIDLHCALLAMPHESRGPRDLTKVPTALAGLSLGVARARRVVVSPLVFEACSEDELRRELQELRARNLFVVDAVQANQRLVIDAFAEFGLKPERDGAGRLRKPGS